MRCRLLGKSMFPNLRPGDLVQVEPGETEGQLIFHLGDGQWDIPRLRELLEDVLPKNSTFSGFEVDHDFPNVGRRKIILNARRPDGGVQVP